MCVLYHLTLWGKHMFPFAAKAAEKQRFQIRDPFRFMTEFLGSFEANFLWKRRGEGPLIVAPNESLFCMICRLVTASLFVCTAGRAALLGRSRAHYHSTSKVNFNLIPCQSVRAKDNRGTLFMSKYKIFIRTLFKLLSVMAPVSLAAFLLLSHCLVMGAGGGYGGEAQQKAVVFSHTPARARRVFFFSFL